MWGLGSGVRFMRLLNFSVYLVGPILFVACMAIQYYQLKEGSKRPWVFTLIIGLMALIPYIWYHFINTYYVLYLVTAVKYMLCGLAGCVGGYLIHLFNKLTKKKHH